MINSKHVLQLQLVAVNSEGSDLFLEILVKLGDI